MVDGIVFDDRFLSDAVNRTRDVYVRTFVVIGQSNSCLHGVFGIGGYLYSIGEFDEFQRGSMKSLVQGGCDGQLVEVVCEGHRSCE